MKMVEDEQRKKSIHCFESEYSCLVYYHYACPSSVPNVIILIHIMHFANQKCVNVEFVAVICVMRTHFYLQYKILLWRLRHLKTFSWFCLRTRAMLGKYWGLT